MTSWELCSIVAANHQRRNTSGHVTSLGKDRNPKLEVQFLLNLSCCYVIKTPNIHKDPHSKVVCILRQKIENVITGLLRCSVCMHTLIPVCECVWDSQCVFGGQRTILCIGPHLFGLRQSLLFFYGMNQIHWLRCFWAWFYLPLWPLRSSLIWKARHSGVIVTPWEAETGGSLWIPGAHWSSSLTESVSTGDNENPNPSPRLS